MKKAPSVAGGAYERPCRETQHTTSSTAQPNRAMIVSRTIRSELFISAGLPQRLCAIKSKVLPNLSRALLRPNRPLHCEISIRPMSALGRARRRAWVLSHRLRTVVCHRTNLLAWERAAHADRLPCAWGSRRRVLCDHYGTLSFTSPVTNGSIEANDETINDFAPLFAAGIENVDLQADPVRPQLAATCLSNLSNLGSDSVASPPVSPAIP